MNPREQVAPTKGRMEMNAEMQASSEEMQNQVDACHTYITRLAQIEKLDIP